MRILKGKYAILGGSGLVGTSILSLLKDVDGAEVVSTYFTREPKIYAKNISHVQMDLRIKSNCENIIDGADYVVLTASNILLYSMPEEILAEGMTSNLLINSQVLESCYKSKIKKLVWISSTTAYPSKKGYLIEDDIFVGDPPEKYFTIGWMIRFIEKLCIIYAEKLKRKMPIAIIRPTCIYGENEGFDLDKCHMLPSMVRKIIDRMEPIEIWGDGEQKRDFIYVEDVATSCIKLLSNGTGLDSFNIGTGNYYSVNEIIDIICKILNINDLDVKYVAVDKEIEKERLISSEKIRKEINFKPSIDMSEGIRKLIKEYKDNYG